MKGQQKTNNNKKNKACANNTAEADREKTASAACTIEQRGRGDRHMGQHSDSNMNKSGLRVCVCACLSVCVCVCLSVCVSVWNESQFLQCGVELGEVLCHCRSECVLECRHAGCAFLQRNAKLSNHTQPAVSSKQ